MAKGFVHFHWRKGGVMKRTVCLFAVLLLVVGAFFCVTLWNGKSEAQEKPYPNKPIQIIENFPAGGPLDIGTRIIVNELTKELGVAINVDYKAGAGGLIGTTYIMSAKPDGYTLLSAMHGAFINAPALEKEPPYDPVNDFTPIMSYVISPNLMATHSSSSLTSFEAMVKMAKEKPGSLNCATSGIGTGAHFVIEIMKMHGVNVTHIPTKGGAPAATQVLGKHVDLAILLYPILMPHIKSGELRILAVTDKMVQEPNFPSFADKGIPEAKAFSGWQGFFGPRNLPKPIVDKLNDALRKVLQMPSVASALEKAGFTVQYLGPEELRARIAEGYGIAKKMTKIIMLEK
jgi:tripartite-type tricarboxylate transporter receptor subunit TctC